MTANTGDLLSAARLSPELVIAADLKGLLQEKRDQIHGVIQEIELLNGIIATATQKLIPVNAVVNADRGVDVSDSEVKSLVTAKEKRSCLENTISTAKTGLESAQKSLLFNLKGCSELYALALRQECERYLGAIADVLEGFCLNRDRAVIMARNTHAYCEFERFPVNQSPATYDNSLGLTLSDAHKAVKVLDAILVGKNPATLDLSH